MAAAAPSTNFTGDRFSRGINILDTSVGVCAHKFRNFLLFINAFNFTGVSWGEKPLWHPWWRPLHGRFDRKSWHLYIPPVFNASVGDLVQISQKCLVGLLGKLALLWLWWRKYDDKLMSSRFDRIPERDKRTASIAHQARVSISVLSRVKNAKWWHLANTNKKKYSITSLLFVRRQHYILQRSWLWILSSLKM